MQHFDTGSIFVILIIFIFFAATIFFFTGLTHDILLEGGVFLVSVKLIIMAYKSSVGSDQIESELKEIKRYWRKVKPRLKQLAILGKK